MPREIHIHIHTDGGGDDDDDSKTYEDLVSSDWLLNTITEEYGEDGESPDELPGPLYNRRIGFNPEPKKARFERLIRL